MLGLDLLGWIGFLAWILSIWIVSGGKDEHECGADWREDSDISADELRLLEGPCGSRGLDAGVVKAYMMTGRAAFGWRTDEQEEEGWRRLRGGRQF